LDKLFAWLRVEPKGFRLWLFFIMIIAFTLFYAFLMGNILESAGIHLKERGDILSFLQEMPVIFMCIVIPIGILIEEFFFRLPLVFLTKAAPKIVLIGTICLSIAFAYIHGGWQQIPVQGFGGLIFCLVFLKCGGLQENPWKAFFSSYFVHIAFDWILLGSILLSPAWA
jgi:membrane protease YdiL (CAAX protease family)